MIVAAIMECPKKGDLVLVQGKFPNSDDNVQLYRISDVKTVDGYREVILFPRKNIWFSWDQYQSGTSWVTDILAVSP